MNETIQGVRCGDCGQRVVNGEFGLPVCPDRNNWLREGWGSCGNDPLTVELRDGPRYVEAIRRAGEYRRAAFGLRFRSRSPDETYSWERHYGIPGWFGR